MCIRDSVYGRLENDALGVEVFLGFPQRLVEPAEWAAAVAGDKARRVQPGGFVAQALQHRQTNEGLRAGQENASRGDRVAAIERGREIAHCFSSCLLYTSRCV